MSTQHVSSRARAAVLPTLFAATAVAAFAGCGKTNGDASSTAAMSDVAYVRIPQAALTASVIRDTGFNRDHKRDDVYAFGYIKRDRLRVLPESALLDLVERQFGS